MLSNSLIHRFNEVLEICKKMVRKCKAFENLKSCAPITLGYKQTNKLEKVEEHSMNLSMQTCA
jgi:hypothetical protein